MLHGTHGGLDFLLKVANRIRKGCLAGGLLHEELGVVALPRPGPEVVDLHDAVAHLVEEVAVVGHDELRPLELRQEGLQPFCRVNVEVVGGFVKENDVDAVEANQLSGQREFGLLATGEFVHGHVHRVLVQSKALENALGDAGHVASTAGGEGLLELSVVFHHRLPVALVEGRVHHLGFDGGDFLLEFLKLPPFAAEFFFDGGIGFKVPDLREVGQSDTGGELHVARVLLLLADGVQEGGFPCTVVTDDADAVAIVHLEVDVLQHIDGTEGAVNGLDVDEFTCHEGPSSCSHR